MRDCFCASSFEDRLFYTQTQDIMNIPFAAGTETTILTLPILSSISLQEVKLDYAIQLTFLFGMGQPDYDYGARVRLRRNGQLLVTQTIRKEAVRPGTFNTPLIHHISNTWVDSAATAMNNTYTVTIEFFQRINTTTTLRVETRSLNTMIF